MAPVAPGLPLRFPCWCRAVYSWGGETKRDLGFIEGDLIECLNAGDGSWWMGRLRRDRRMVGLFPSNFVQLLDESFQPGSRSPSPLPQSSGSISSATKPSPQKSKSVFRKPFQAYHAAGSPNPVAAARNVQEKNVSPNLTPQSSVSKHRPYSAMKRSSTESRPSPPVSQNLGSTRLRATSPMPVDNSRSTIPVNPSFTALHSSYSRAASPIPPRNNSFSGSHSPAPHRGNSFSRAHSPVPSFQHHSRSPSPNPYYPEASSSPPPPPPPHRTMYGVSRAPSPVPANDIRQEGYHTPEPPPNRNFTPSPLTSAMNDVMSSLQGMGIPRDVIPDDRPRTPGNIWSPDSFDQAYDEQARKFRPQTSLGIGVQDDHHSDGYQADTIQRTSNGQHRVDDYVQRMESRLRKMQEQEAQMDDESMQGGPPPPPKTMYPQRPQSSIGQHGHYDDNGRGTLRKTLKNRKSAYELGREVLGRTFTIKSTVTTASSAVQSQSSNSTQQSSRSIMSGISAGGFSATSAGSLARRKWALGNGRPLSAMASSRTQLHDDRPETPFTGVTYHSSHASQQSGGDYSESNGGILGGLSTPKHKKSGFFKRVKDTVKTGAANARSTIASGQISRPVSRQTNTVASSMQAIAGPSPSSPSMAARDMGLGAGIDWVQVRRDVNRSNSLSGNERIERIERAQMMDLPVISPIEILIENVEGDESLDGLPVTEPMDFTHCNLSLVDKSARFVNSLPPMTNSISLAQGFLCRPHRSDVQRLRAIFTWVSERVAWEDDFEGEIDSRRVIQSRRGCAEEVAVLVMEMCRAVGVHAEVVRGYLKSPGDTIDLDLVARPNHWWNAVIIEGEWRIIDCCLANPTNPKRALYSNASSQVADNWWFLARPVETCFTHVPLLPEQQHIVPPMAHDVLMALPCACPPYFKNGLQLVDFNTSLLQLEDLEQAHIHFFVPDDVECVAEVEAQALARDADGDFFESGDVIRKRALAQAEWIGGRKRYAVKALLPGEEGSGVLKVYAGKRGLMHSIKSNPHPPAFAVQIQHHGQNPPYDFLIRHPTPHAQRHDLYVAQPQCLRLAVNNTFVFAVRQHPSSLTCSSPNIGDASAGGSTSRAPSPAPFARPTSAMSMTSASTSAYSNPSNSSSGLPNERKPAKLAIQSPSGKIIRLTRRSDYSNGGPGGDGSEGGVWETVIKIGERGTWRGLVLADRTARWCVFAEWESI